MRTSRIEGLPHAVPACASIEAGSHPMTVPFRNVVLACIVLCLAGSEARSADKIVLGMIGAGSTVHWPTYIATEKGFFAKRNLNIDVVITPSNAAMQQQIAAGALDIGVSAGSPDPIRAVDKARPR
jgi:ABC-type nitrate/sulfonate/bicarbonate transport system substrate-binding protein